MKHEPKEHVKAPLGRVECAIFKHKSILRRGVLGGERELRFRLTWFHIPFLQTALGLGRATGGKRGEAE